MMTFCRYTRHTSSRMCIVQTLPLVRNSNYLGYKPVAVKLSAIPKIFCSIPQLGEMILALIIYLLLIQ